MAGVHLLFSPGPGHAAAFSWDFSWTQLSRMASGLLQWGLSSQLGSQTFHMVAGFQERKWKLPGLLRPGLESPRMLLLPHSVDQSKSQDQPRVEGAQRHFVSQACACREGRSLGALFGGRHPLREAIRSPWLGYIPTWTIINIFCFLNYPSIFHWIKWSLSLFKSWMF